MISRKNIWFKCPACEKKLVVDAGAGGYRAPCPECGKTIPIPVHSTVYPTWVRKALIVGGQVAIVLACIVGSWFYVSGGAVRVESVQVSAPAATARPAEDKAKPSSPGESPTEEINQQLLSEHVQLQDRYNKMLQWMMDNYRGKYPLPERLVGNLRISPVTDNNELNPDLVEMLKMTDDEKVMVQDIFDYVRGNLSAAELERMQVTEQNADRITFTVPTYADVGGTLKEDLYSGLETALGGARFDRMVDVAGEEMREKFNYFGEASRSLTFEVIYPEVEGAFKPYVLIRDGWVIPEGDSVRLTKVTETAISSMPESYREYEQYLPTEIGRYTAQ